MFTELLYTSVYVHERDQKVTMETLEPLGHPVKTE